MKKILLVVLCAIAMLNVNAKSKQSIANYCGVWVNNNCEVVQTGKYTLVFRNNGDSISTYIRKVGEVGKQVKSLFSRGYNFNATTNSCQPMECPAHLKEITLSKIFKLSDGKMLFTMGGVTDTLQLAERIVCSEPAEMEVAMQGNIGKCLQSWNLGTHVYGLTDDNFHIQIGTNRHSFLVYCTPTIVYWRSARIHSSNSGSVFSQNIKLMKNGDSFTMYMSKNNAMEATTPLVISASEFVPNKLSIAPDGSIYWSLTSFTPNLIQLNGKDSAYKFARPSCNDRNHVEWFAYDEY